jgi:hypothetical protein
MKYLKRLLFKPKVEINSEEIFWLQYYPKHLPPPDGWRSVVKFGDHEHLWRAQIIKKD